MTVSTPAAPVQRIRARTREILEYDGWSRTRLLELQQERLRELLHHAVQSSPYYREALGADAPDRPLDSLPTLPKRVLMEQFDGIVTDPSLRRRDLERFLAETRPGQLYGDRHRVFFTSGTTGVPGFFVYTPEEFLDWIAVGLARLARLGVGAETRLVAIGAPGDAHITRQLFAAFQSAREDVPRLSVATPLHETVDALNVYQPEAMIAYASVLGALADEHLEGRLEIQPRLTIATSEVLTTEVAERVARAWGNEPINVYAATEAPGIAMGSLAQVGMHVCEESLVFEVVDDETRPVRPGEPGAKVLLTNLVNRTQPLIRYELSDSVVLAEGADPSGLPWLRIERVDGRSDDILALPARDGGEVRVHPHHLRAPFARLNGVRGYQIVHRADGLLVRIVPRPGAGAPEAERVRAAVSAAVCEAGADVCVRVEAVDEIAREPGPAAKAKLVRSEV
jgi:putative adenylate-forming enzyme